ncbi:MAG: protein translocase subunit SecF [Candidatus Thiodiazotropha sp. (ex Epidulcina cf. delphinae)]|nr:protein translocase subunit SecF [Candidatus Thiodiazotropha sp. (ex Epidulcina cf. delphinae)]
MQIINKDSYFDLMGKRHLALIFSGMLLLVALGAIIVRGLNFGIDFTGGTLVEVGYPQAVALSEVREALSQDGFGDTVVQHFGTSRDVLVRLAPREDMASAVLSDRAFNVMQGIDAGADLRRVEFVGPQVGDELTEDGGMAMLYALIGILIYVGLRFEYRFAVGSVIALVHDVLVTIGFFALFQVEFDLPVLAAVLAVIGYSLNDTIVVFDRIRENFRKIRKDDSIDIINISINQTLSRTLITSGTTLLVLIALFLFGGEIIHGFALALIVGVVIGTYSSIYVASSSVISMGVSRADMMPVKKEDGEPDEMP